MERELGPGETELVGQWLDTGNRIEGDAVAARIAWLTGESLVRLAVAEWGTLYRDPRDGRLWELSYPHAELRGGGPPRLAAIAPATAAAKYGVRTS